MGQLRKPINTSGTTRTSSAIGNNPVALFCSLQAGRGVSGIHPFGLVHPDQHRNKAYQGGHTNSQHRLDQAKERVGPCLGAVFQNDNPADIPRNLGGLLHIHEMAYLHGEQYAESERPWARPQHRNQHGSARGPQHGGDQALQPEFSGL